MKLVSVIVPCYNEEARIGLLLEALLHQTYPREAMEVIIADGLSTDRTREVVERFRQQHPELAVKVVDNPKRIIPAALNVALGVASGAYVIRLDAHSVPASDYIEQCVADLEANLGDNVGGIWIIRPGAAHWLARSIALAAAHPLGVGDARYRFGHQAGLVDTVPFGAFRRDLFERVGHFDERLLTNEDYEFNARLRDMGGRVYLDPKIRCEYFARPTLGALARQYWRYGFWKFRMLIRYPHTLRWRQALPPLFVSSVAGLALIAPFRIEARVLLGWVVMLYLVVLLLGALPVVWRTKEARHLIGLPLAIATMHFAWGSGFLWSMIKALFERDKTSR